jgi:hypothetical protein
MCAITIVGVVVVVVVFSTCRVLPGLKIMTHLHLMILLHYAYTFFYANGEAACHASYGPPAVALWHP